VAGLMADARGLSLTTSCGSGQATTVLGDFPSLRRMLWVLLDKAVKYTDPPGRIEVALKDSLRSGHSYCARQW